MSSYCCHIILKVLILVFGYYIILQRVLSDFFNSGGKCCVDEFCNCESGTLNERFNLLSLVICTDDVHGPLNVNVFAL